MTSRFWRGLAPLALPFFLWACAQAEPTAEPLSLTPVRRLQTRAPLFPEGPLFFSAASGLVKRGEAFYVVADDAQVLGRFEGTEPGTHQAVLQRAPLPADMEVRKKIKPDLEALTFVETSRGDGLLALGSGSGDYRYSGAFLPFAWFGGAGSPVEFDLTPLYSELSQRFPQLNIEGVSVVGDRLRLLQRGNGNGANALIDLELQGALEAAVSGRPLDPQLVREVIEVELGTTPGPSGPVRWTFTDLCPLRDGRSLFTAAAEDTDSPYEDGEILGSAIGVLERDGRVSHFRRVKQCVKLEGLARDGDTLYTVTDPDDPNNPATLYRTEWALEF